MKSFKLFASILFLVSFSAHAENVIKSITILKNSFSAVSTDGLTAYAGMVGIGCAGDTNSTCNSCTDTTSGTPKACNQNSIYPSLKVRISFQVNKAIPSGTASLLVESATAGTFTSLATVPVTSTGDGVATEIFTLETTWSAICGAIGLPTNCVAPGPAAFALTRSLGIGMDGVTTPNGSIDSDERKVIILKAHFLPEPFSDRTQAYCPTNSTADVAGRSGICNMTFIPGASVPGSESMKTL